MPKLISFDIGIKNLAYCIFDFSSSDSDSTTKIIDWNVLDISKSKEEEKTEKTEICSCIVSQKTKTKKINQCKKKAKYQKDNHLYCETHAKKSGFLLPIQTKQFSHSFLKKLSLEKLLELETNPEFFPEIQIQIQNENQKKETKSEKIERIYRQFQEKSLVLINKAKKTKSGTVDLIEIGRNLHKQLSSLKHLDGMDYVLIENQISPIANKMKTIQGMVTQIFIMRDVPNIEFISSVNKLRGFSREKEEEEEEEAKKGINPNYKQHKKDGIEYCQQWLQKDIFCSWNSFFEKYPKKQDDLADSFLQGIWYLQKMKIL
jgi:hypothetical protein